MFYQVAYNYYSERDYRFLQNLKYKNSNLSYIFSSLNKDSLMSKMKSADDAKIDGSFFPMETVYPKTNAIQFMMNIGKKATNKLYLLVI